MNGVIFTSVDVLAKLAFQPAVLFWGLICFVNLCFLAYILRQSFRGPALNILVFYFLSILFWGGAGLFQSITVNPLGAGYWFIISTFILGLLPAIFLLFILTYIKNQRIGKNAIFQIVLIIPSIVFIQFSLSTDFVTNPHILPFIPNYFGWNNPVHPSFLYIYFAWILAVILGSLFLLLQYYRKSVNKDLSKQITQVMLAFAVPGGLVLGSLMLSIISRTFEFPNLVILFFTASGISLSYILIQKKIYTFEPGEIIPDIIDNLKEAIIVINRASLSVEYVNQTALNLLKTTSGNLLGVNILKLSGKESKLFLSYLSGIGKDSSRNLPFETSFLSFDGTIVPVTILATPLFAEDKSVASIVMIISDLSQIKELLNINIEQKKLAAIIESVSDGVLALNLQGQISLINSRAVNILNIERLEIMGKDIREFVSILYSDNYLNISDYFKNIKNSSNTITLKEARVITPKTNTPADITLSALFSGNQTNLGLIITIHDLTEEKKLAEKKLDFVTIAAHEIRTPLTALRSYTYLWLHKNHPQSNAVNAIVSRINFSTDKLISIVEKLIKNTRIERTAD